MARVNAAVAFQRSFVPSSMTAGQIMTQMKLRQSDIIVIFTEQF